MRKVTLDDNVCAGFGNCALTAPEIFRFDDAELIGQVVREEIDDTDPEQLANAKLAEADCPTHAIQVN
ncbi:ferredoxin [Jatrophihabitans sp. GAS493]|uniref:ferredoxin n=1 Tax=Jatrophihabitans sp. GAS493 TaxID=1907575 RepID=UPI000BB6C237|nr:ferredoxin [Jatrophihabitans sp. GAS493]SOD73143.1 ferredoxin [Jatrophihabitans sp. GAS493]